MDFHTFEFPNAKSRNVVYYLTYGSASAEEVPFYVGESSRHIGRIGDYITANLSAPTDFKIGVACRYLQELGFTVKMHYAEVEDRRKAESDLEERFGASFALLNQLNNGLFRERAEADAKRVVGEYVSSKVLNRKETNI